MKKSLITLLLLCTAVLVQAATLKGVVKDSSTGEPLTGATVNVNSKTYYKNGEYVKNGNVRIEEVSLVKE